MPEKEIRTASLVTPFENGSFNSWDQEYPRPQNGGHLRDMVANPHYKRKCSAA